MKTRFFLAIACAMGLAFAADSMAARPFPSNNPDDVVIEGVLGMLVGDPPPGSGLRSQKHFLLYTEDGRSYELDLTGATMPPGGVHSLVRKRVRARAKMLADTLSRRPDAPQRLKVDDVRSMEAPRPKTFAESGAVTGTQPYVTLMCKYSDQPAEPRTQSFFVTQLNNTQPGFTHYFAEASYNTLSLTGSSATAGWASLGHPKTYYLDGVKTPGTYLTQIFSDCTTAHNASIDFSQYYGVNIMLNETLTTVANSAVAWGGQTSFITLDGVGKNWPATWMPYHGEGWTFGWREHGVLGHELSHSFGAPHSQSPEGNEYGNDWDVVSNPGAVCTTTDANYGCLSQHMNAYAKGLMGFISPGRIATHVSGATTYNIERLAQPPNAAGTYQIVEVPITGTSTRWYTIESRHRVGYDVQLPGDGVVIHEIDTSRATGNDASLVVPGGAATPGYGGSAALWQAGMVYTNTVDNVRITVNGISGTGTANVTVEPYAAVTDTWPPVCALPTGWTVPGGSTTGWSATTTSAAYGNCSLMTNALTDPPNDGTRYTAAIEYTGGMGSGNVTFWARASSEPGWDCLKMTIDGAEQNLGSCGTAGVSGAGGSGLTPSSNASPDTGWRFFSIPVTAGTRTVRFTYTKDVFARGLDAAWIDSVVFPTAETPGLPAAPTIGTATAGAGQVSVTFTPGNLNTGVLTNHHVTCAAATGPAFNGTGAASPIVVTGLLAGTAYRCWARTITNLGTGPWSGASNFATPTAVTGPPAAPAIGTATAGAGLVSVTFTPGSLNGGVLTNHHVTCAAATGPAFNGTGAASPIIVAGLTAGTAYRCWARTITNLGTSAWSMASNFATPTSATGPPSAPAIGTATAGAGQVSVTFTPGSLNGGVLTNHHVTCAAATGPAFNGTGAASPIIVSGLTAGTAYRCWARTITNLGTSPWSGASNFATPTATTGPPTAPVVGTATAGAAQVSVTFTPGGLNGGVLTHHHVTCAAATGPAFNGYGPGSPIAVMGLTSGTAYRCWVRTVTNLGTSAWSGASNYATPTNGPPAAPTMGMATAGGGQVSVAFTPGSLNGGVLTHHHVTCAAATGPAFNNTGGSSPIVVMGLTNGTAYRCWVRTITNLGTGAWSMASNYATPAAP